MAAITLTYVYPAGNDFNVTNHNANVYSTTGGRAIFSESNGYLDTNNLAGGFELQAYHVMPEEAVFARHDGALDSTDFFEAESYGDSETDMFYVGGAGLRVYVPYDVTAIQWNVMFHVQPHVFLDETVVNESAVTARDDAVGSIQYLLRLNGSNLTHTRRLLPAKVRVDKWNSGGAAPYTDPVIREKIRRASFPVNLQHLQTDVSAGWHDINLACYISRNSLPEDVLLLLSPTSQFKGSYQAYQRVTFGVRSATALVLL